MMVLHAYAYTSRSVSLCQVHIFFHFICFSRHHFLVSLKFHAIHFTFPRREIHKVNRKKIGKFFNSANCCRWKRTFLMENQKEKQLKMLSAQFTYDQIKWNLNAIPKIPAIRPSSVQKCTYLTINLAIRQKLFLKSVRTMQWTTCETVVWIRFICIPFEFGVDAPSCFPARSQWPTTLRLKLSKLNIT